MDKILERKNFLIEFYHDQYILSNKRNAPNIKLHHRFIFTLKDCMSVYVRYEYHKMFELTKKNIITEH